MKCTARKKKTPTTTISNFNFVRFSYFFRLTRARARTFAFKEITMTRQQPKKLFAIVYFWRWGVNWLAIILIEMSIVNSMIRLSRCQFSISTIQSNKPLFRQTSRNEWKFVNWNFAIHCFSIVSKKKQKRNLFYFRLEFIMRGIVSAPHHIFWKNSWKDSIEECDTWGVSTVCQSTNQLTHAIESERRVSDEQKMI